MGLSATIIYFVQRIIAYSAEAMKGLQDWPANFHAYDALANICVGFLWIILLGGLYSLDDQECFPGQINLV